MITLKISLVDPKNGHFWIQNLRKKEVIPLYPLQIHGTDIVTYMNRWFSWFSCKVNTHLHGCHGSLMRYMIHIHHPPEIEMAAWKQLKLPRSLHILSSWKGMFQLDDEPNHDLHLKKWGISPFPSISSWLFRVPVYIISNFQLLQLSLPFFFRTYFFFWTHTNQLPSP